MSDEREKQQANQQKEAAETPSAAVRDVIVEPPETEAAANPTQDKTDSRTSDKIAGGEPGEDGAVEPEEGASAALRDDDGAGLFARLGNAFKGFFRGLRGLPVEIPPGEEGTIPVAEAAILQRKLEKRLAKAQAQSEELRAAVEQHQQGISERDASLKEAQRELKGVRAEAAEAEAGLRKETEAAQSEARAAGERIQRLQNELAGREARLGQRDADLEARDREITDLRRAAGEKERELAGQLGETRRELDTRAAELARTEEARAQGVVERDAARRRVEELEKELGQWRMELAARDETLAELRQRGAAAAARAKAELDEARGELEFTKSTLAEKESALELLLGEVKNQESESDRVRDEAAQQQAQLQAEIEEWKRKFDEAEAVMAGMRKELVKGLPKRAEFEELRTKAGQLERELAKKSAEAELLREDLIGLRRREAEAEERARKGDEAETQKAALQRDLQRQSVQIEALRDQFTEAQLKVEKLSAALRDFHGPAVSTIQAAAVYAESLAASLAMNETDRNDAQEMKQNVEKLRQTMQKLTAKLAELGVPHS
jgi:chromosome segregation ATPase